MLILKQPPKLKAKLNKVIIKEYPELEDLEITPTIQEQNFKSEKYGYDNVTVKGIETKEINLNPSTEEQVKEGLFDKVIVAGDSELVAENIKSGVEIFGVTGTAEVRGEENAVIETQMSNASFSNNIQKYIKEIPVLNFGTQNAFSQTFLNMTSLITIPQIDFSYATTFYQMFSGCTSLETIPSLNTPRLKNTGYMFNDCKSLKDVSLFNTNNVTNMMNMFYGCTNLETIPAFNTAKSTDMSNMFSNCKKLSNESLNNIMAMCTTATSYTGTKTLRQLGLTSTQATTCKSLSNYQAFLDAGWTTGY